MTERESAITSFARFAAPTVDFPLSAVFVALRHYGGAFFQCKVEGEHDPCSSLLSLGIGLQGRAGGVWGA